MTWIPPSHHRARSTRASLAFVSCVTFAALVSPALGQPGPTLEATARLADGPRTVWLPRSPRYGHKFDPVSGRDHLRLTNPYLDPQRILFSSPVDMQCRSDGGLMVASGGGFNGEGRTTVSGWWQVAPDGAVRPWQLNGGPAKGSNAPQCNAPLKDTDAGAERFVIRPDGDLLLLKANAVLRLTAAGDLQMLSGTARMCREYVRGLNQVVDGPAEEARFSNGNQSPAGALDGEGRLWISDRDFSLLRRVATDGSVSTVIGAERTGPKLPLEDQVRFFHMAWDATRGEMVTGGDTKTTGQLFTTIWRIRPDGSARRVLLGHKEGRSAAGVLLDGVQGLAVDAQGRIVFASRNMRSDAVALFRVDEAKGAAVQLTGMRLPVPASSTEGALDGPADKAYFNRIHRICAGGDGQIFIHDDVFIRRLDTRGGQVSTWVF